MRRTCTRSCLASVKSTRIFFSCSVVVCLPGESVKALYDDVCVVYHVVGFEDKRPVSDVLILRRVLHVLQLLREVVDRQFEEEFVAFHNFLKYGPIRGRMRDTDGSRQHPIRHPSGWVLFWGIGKYPRHPLTYLTVRQPKNG